MYSDVKWVEAAAAQYNTEERTFTQLATKTYTAQ